MSPLRFVVALVCGLLFGFGLALSRMVDPVVVRGFLDVFGNWDPSLLGVMAAAIPVTFLFYAVTRRRGRAIAADAVPPAPSWSIDARLVGGAVLFGIGWGLVGFCPAPALVAWIAQPSALLFIAAMVAGIAVQKLIARRAPVAASSKI
jgi:uncharacterized membrane protein YedE/YeeE